LAKSLSPALALFRSARRFRNHRLVILVSRVSKEIFRRRASVLSAASSSGEVRQRKITNFWGVIVLVTRSARFAKH
jgi:hypothetical protein